jgi:broad specificity phosphatase PhoE
MLRTRQTLERLQAVGVARNVTFDERLREMDFGNYEMKTFAQLAKSGVDMAGWLEYTHFAFPGGESVAHFSQRLQEVLAFFHTCSEDQLLVLAHGGVIRTLLCLLLGLDIKNYLLFAVDHASWSTVELYSEGGVLTGLNKSTEL